MSLLMLLAGLCLTSYVVLVVWLVESDRLRLSEQDRADEIESATWARVNQTLLASPEKLRDPEGLRCAMAEAGLLPPEEQLAADIARLEAECGITDPSSGVHRSGKAWEAWEAARAAEARTQIGEREADQ